MKDNNFQHTESRNEGEKRRAKEKKTISKGKKKAEKNNTTTEERGDCLLRGVSDNGVEQGPRLEGKTGGKSIIY